MTAPERHSTGAAGQRRRQAPDQVLELVGERLRVVADPTRMRIMRYLESCGSATVQQVCDGLGGAHQNVSKHLRMLLGAGMVMRAREGNSMRYELADFTALWVIEKMAASVQAQLEAQHERFADV